MKKLSYGKKQEVLDCIQLLEYGDYIEHRGDCLSVYNASGCLINVITI